MAQIATAQKLYCCPVLPLSIRHFFLSTPPSAPRRFSSLACNVCARKRISSAMRSLSRASENSRVPFRTAIVS